MDGHTQTLRTLLVDSDPVSRAVSADVLEAAGIPVVGQASDEAEAMSLVTAATPNVAIIDVEIGGMGPATLANRLREISHRRIEIVAQAGFANLDSLGEMVAGGVSAYVIKGKPAELIAAVKAVTSGSGLMSAEASRPVLEEIQNLYDRERARNGELEQMVTQLQALSVTDWLTGLKNHGYFFDRLSEELERARRYGRPLSVIVADLDNFKAVNDAYGHASGDAVLRTIGEVFRRQLREVDVACRIGGEEFGVIMPETGIAGAVKAAERLRVATAETSMSGVGAITVSLGVAVFPDHADARDQLVEAADQALYVAKHAGKNQTTIAGDTSEDDSRRRTATVAPLTKTMLNALRQRSASTADHSERVAKLAVDLGVRMGHTEHELHVLRTAALLHDVGRLTLPDSVLNRPGALSESDWELMRAHPRNAYEMLVGSFEAEITRVVLTHHEHLDGSGYPNGLAADEIPLASRILLVVDAYDAMTSHRLHRGALAEDVALRELEAAAGVQLDADVVAAFGEMILDGRRDNVVQLPVRNVS